MSDETARPLLVINTNDVIREQGIMEQKPNKFIRATNINNMWVVIKKHNGNTFFKRKNYMTCVKSQPDSNCLYSSKEEVEVLVSKLNSSRKKCMFSYDNASKYFVNSWDFNKWGGNVIKNIPIPIKKINKETKLKSPKLLKDEIAQTIAESIKNRLERIESLQNELPKHLAKIQEECKQNTQRLSDEKLTLEIELAEILELDLDKELSLYETQGDKIVKILYGSSK